MPALVKVLKLKGSFAKRVGSEVSRTFKFVPGVNILAGPNGSGKSTILEALMPQSGDRSGKLRELEFDPGPCNKFDFEKQNPRTLGYFMEGAGAVAFQMNSKFKSHGESMKALVEGLLGDAKVPGSVVLLDEPEQALDLDGLELLVRCLKKTKANQVIIASHAPALILHPEFHVIEMVPGYKKRLRASVEKLVSTVDHR